MANILESNIDTNLVQAAKSGSQSAFAELYDAYIKKIYNFIYYKTLHKDVAEDITSDVFLKAWKNISQLQGDNFSAWLYSVARHAVIDYYRACKNIIDIEDCWDLPANDDLLTNTDNALKVGLIKEAMQGLTPQDREIIMMRLWLDLSFKEIAEQLDKQEGAVKVAFSRALSRLKDKAPLPLFIVWLNLL